MKRQVTWLLLLTAVLGAAFWFSGSLSATERKSTVPRDKNVVMVKKKDWIQFTLPGTTMSTGDAEAMNKILDKYDKTLFRIDTYEKGRRKKTRGALTDVITDKRLTSEIAAAVNEGFSQFALQVRGWDDNPTLSPTPKAKNLPVPSPSTDPTNSNQNRTRNREMFDRLEQILKKYQRK